VTRSDATGSSPPTAPVALLVPFTPDQASVALAIVTRAQVPNAQGKQLQGQVQQLLEDVLSSAEQPPEPKE
jgi:hypothetical protein